MHACNIVLQQTIKAIRNCKRADILLMDRKKHVMSHDLSAVTGRSSALLDLLTQTDDFTCKGLFLSGFFYMYVSK